MEGLFFVLRLVALSALSSLCKAAASPAEGAGVALRGTQPSSLAAANATGRSLQSIDSTSCGSAQWLGGDAGNDDVWPGDGSLSAHYPGNYQGRQNEISSTPFPVRRDGTFSPSKDAFCNDADVSWYAGSPDGAKAWLDETQPDKNYFVLHGCDGAGLQVGDCLGDVKYVEQFGPRCEWGVDPGCDMSACDDWHKPCPFRHPGTGVGYRWYNCGWWSWGNDWVDTGKPWFGYTGIEDPPNSEGSMLLYPWVCGRTGQDWSWYWGGESYHHGGGAADTMENDWKCYCDNEPNDQSQEAHWDSHIPPPSIGAYKLWKEGDKIKAGSAFDSNAWFTLSGQAYPPW